MRRELETDGVPVPSKFDPVHRRQTITVETLPVENLRVAVQTTKFTFSQFVDLVGLTYQVYQFRHHVATKGELDAILGESEWWKLFERRPRLDRTGDDAKDLADTQADSLR